MEACRKYPQVRKMQEMEEETKLRKLKMAIWYVAYALLLISIQISHVNFLFRPFSELSLRIRWLSSIFVETQS